MYRVFCYRSGKFEAAGFRCTRRKIGPGEKMGFELYTFGSTWRKYSPVKFWPLSYEVGEINFLNKSYVAVNISNKESIDNF